MRLNGKDTVTREKNFPCCSDSDGGSARVHVCAQ